MSDNPNTLYIFVDEAGDMDFSAKGSQYYMFNFLVKRRPFVLHERIANYRYELLERNLYNKDNTRLDIESFHAHKDSSYYTKIQKYLFDEELMTKDVEVIIMRNDPFYLSEEASLGVLSVDGNFECILSKSMFFIKGNR